MFLSSDKFDGTNSRGYPHSNMKQKSLFGILGMLGLICVASYTLSAQSSEPMAVLKDAPKQPVEPVKKSEEEWKKQLTPKQYEILRKAGTERANGDVYKQFKKQGGGTYYCAGCNAELFSSDTKFDSQCGWPSFYDPSKAKNIKTAVDFHLGYARTEVRCKVCDGHLGHVFTGERFQTLGGKQTPTGKRYCINGTVLKFVPHGEKKEGEKKDKKAGDAKKEK